MEAAIRERHIALMELTLAILKNVLHSVSQEDATTYRDGADGWTVLEVLCHLRDFDRIFHERARMMLAEDYPQLPAYDHEQMAIDARYNEQDLREVYEELAQSRQAFIAFFNQLDEDAWQKAGVHPERGHFTMLDALMQVGHHDVVHIEQITRILTQRP
ncbi:MAG: DinB family protein [Chloroflexi bacterium]|nr:MAG: DinB family protein [Chloroflexota bacterium]